MAGSYARVDRTALREVGVRHEYKPAYRTGCFLPIGYELAKQLEQAAAEIGRRASASPAPTAAVVEL